MHSNREKGGQRNEGHESMPQPNSPGLLSPPAQLRVGGPEQLRVLFG